MDKTITKFNKNQRLLFFICWLTYVSTYICRLNYSAVMPELISNSPFNNTELASIGSAFFITYGISQIFSGYLGDKFKAENVCFIGLFMSSLTNIVMSFVTFSLIGMIIIWALNGFAQSMIWSPLLKIGGDYFEKEKKEKFGLLMSTTVPIGTIIAYGCTIAFIELFTWKYVFLGCGIILLFISLVWIFYTKYNLKKYEKVTEINDTEKDTIDNKEALPKKIRKTCFFVMAVCLFPIAIHGALKDGITQFGPTYIETNFEVGTSFSIMVTMILPIINVTGAFIAKWLNKYIQNEFLTTMVFFTISLISIILLNFFSNVHIALTIILLALVTNSMFAINVMMIYFIPLKFAKYGKTSTMSGILNAVAYIGCSISMIVTGKILDTSSWTGVYALWFGLALGGIIICLLSFNKWKKINSEL